MKIVTLKIWSEIQKAVLKDKRIWDVRVQILLKTYNLASGESHSMRALDVTATYTDRITPRDKALNNIAALVIAADPNIAGCESIRITAKYGENTFVSSFVNIGDGELKTLADWKKNIQDLGK